jgi:hypothetical protein
MEISVKEIALYTLPAFILATITLVIVAYRSIKMTRTVQKYQDDFYRQSIENKITDLEQQLVISKQRFESVNHLLLDGQKATKNSMWPSIDDNDNRFFQSLGIDKNKKVDEDLVFVIMPFNKEFNYTYEIVKGSIQDIGLKCRRGDEEKVSSNILSHIIQEMVQAKLIIADITGRNPNVFYELGIAHALDKPVLVISQSSAEIPFDLNYIRILLYNNGLDLSKSLTKWLLSTLRAVK